MYVHHERCAGPAPKFLEYGGGDPIESACHGARGPQGMRANARNVVSAEGEAVSKGGPFQGRVDVGGQHMFTTLLMGDETQWGRRVFRCTLIKVR
jgi:hypothetical protein